MARNIPRHGTLIRKILGGVLVLAALTALGCGSRETLETIRASRDAGRRLRHVEIQWDLAHSFAFDETDDLEGFRVTEGEWDIHDGMLRAVGGDRNRAIMLVQSGYDPVRIEFDATNHSSRGLIGDITILLDSRPEKTFFSDGYALTTGSYWNTCTTFYRRGVALANTAWSPVRSGQRNHIVFLFDRGHIRYEMNGEILLETWDVSPLRFSPDRWIGIRTWATSMEIDNVCIYQGRVAETR